MDKLKQPSLLDFLTGPPPPPPPTKEDLENLLRDAREERKKTFESEGYWAATRKAQSEAVAGLFGGGPPPPPARSPSSSAPPQRQASSGMTDAASGDRISPAACAPTEPGCLQSDLLESKKSATAYMVPWAFPTKGGTAAAAQQLRGALKQQGAQSVDTQPAGGGALRVKARFGFGPLGLPLFHDSVEFILSDEGPAGPVYGKAMFRAAAETDGFPFSNSRMGVVRNRERLLLVRKQLFGRPGWRCGCPEELSPIEGARCALFCN